MAFQKRVTVTRRRRRQARRASYRSRRPSSRPRRRTRSAPALARKVRSIVRSMAPPKYIVFQLGDPIDMNNAWANIVAADIYEPVTPAVDSSTGAQRYGMELTNYRFQITSLKIHIHHNLRKQRLSSNPFRYRLVVLGARHRVGGESSVTPPFVQSATGYQADDTFNYIGDVMAYHSTYNRDNAWTVLLDQKFQWDPIAAFSEAAATDQVFEWTNSVVVPLRKWLVQLDQSAAESTNEYLSGNASLFKKGYICCLVVADEPRLTGASTPFSWTYQWAHELKYRSL